MEQPGHPISSSTAATSASAASPGLTSLARSLSSIYQLLPEYACLDQPGGLARTTDVALPELDTAMVPDAMRFHAELREAEAQHPASLQDTYAIIGVGQATATATTAMLARDRVELVATYQGEDLAGDSTVPIVGSCRPDVPMDSNMLRRYLASTATCSATRPRSTRSRES